jgi:hypothetical protein
MIPHVIDAFLFMLEDCLRVQGPVFMILRGPDASESAQSVQSSDECEMLSLSLFCLPLATHKPVSAQHSWR